MIRMDRWRLWSLALVAICFGAVPVSAQIFASSENSDEVFCFDPQSGVLIGSGPFIPAGSGGLSRPHGILDRTNGPLVASFNTAEVKRYDRDTGAYVDNFITNGAGLSLPVHMAIGPSDGLLYISSQGNDRILRFNRDTGAVADGSPFIDGGLLDAPSGFDWSPDGTILYVAGRASGNVLAYDASTGRRLRTVICLRRGSAPGTIRSDWR